MMYFASQGKVSNDKTTIEENNIEAGTTIEMSLRMIGGMDKESRWKQPRQKRV